MEDELFKKTEGRLYRYYEGVKDLDKLELEITELKNQKETLIENIKSNNVSIEHGLNMGISYGEVVQTSSSGVCYAEREIIKGVERLERELADVIRMLFEKEARVREIKRNAISIGKNLDDFKEENKRFIELKYSEKIDIPEIADILNMSRASAYRKREELVKSVYQWSKFER